MREYEYPVASEPTLTSSSEVLQAIKGHRAGKAPMPNGVVSRVPIHYLSAL